jgi:uncharacterized protein YpuA (DUF1002 family)
MRQKDGVELAEILLGEPVQGTGVEALAGIDENVSVKKGNVQPSADTLGAGRGSL